MHLPPLINFLPLRNVKLSWLLVFPFFPPYSLYTASFSNCCFHFHLEWSQNQTPFFKNYGTNRTFSPGWELLVGTSYFLRIYVHVYFSSQQVSLTSLFSLTDPGRSTRYMLLLGTVFYYPIINVIRSWSPVSRQPPISSSVINSSLSIIIRSKIELPHVRCHLFCARKLS